MNNEQLYIFAKIVANIALIDSMKVANAAREHSGFAYAYSEDAFKSIAIELEYLALRALNL
jgi:hypothetical protein